MPRYAPGRTAVRAEVAVPSRWQRLRLALRRWKG